MSETGPADVIRRTVLLEVHLVAGVILKGIGKVYPGGVRAVTDFNLKIKNKEFIVFVGPSGCGKSTTLRMSRKRLTASFFLDVMINGANPPT